MKKRFRISITAEYDVDSKTLKDNYNTTDFQKGLEVDVQNAVDDPMLFLELMDDIVVKGEIVDG